MIMRNKCKDYQKMIVSSKYDELDKREQKLLIEHISKCSGCAVLIEKVNRADQIVNKLKRQPAFIIPENEITEQIMNKIHEQKDLKYNFAGSLFFDLLTKRSIRFSMRLFVFAVMTLFVYMNYSDVTKIVELEKSTNNRFKKEINTAELLKQETGMFDFIYKTYKFINGDESVLELSKNLLLINKKEFGSLMKEYENIDRNTKEKILELREKLLNETEPSFKAKLYKNQINILFEEIKKLEKELEKNKLGIK